MADADMRIAVTPGEPAGIGPDLVIELAHQPLEIELVAVADPKLLRARAAAIGRELTLSEYDPGQNPHRRQKGELVVCPVSMPQPAEPGRLDKRNGAYVLQSLKRAAQGCLDGEFAAMVTAPVNKAVINDSGVPFSGHTEFLAEFCGARQPVMLLCAGDLRVGLVTTHLRLRDVPAAITDKRVERITRILDADLQRLFGLAAPRIAVLGLNPHAGEGGHLGDEETRIITPVLRKLRREGLDLAGPLPADSAFTRQSLTQFDAVLAMYHDQGLPVLKHAGFGNAVNVTLGLPIVRTSVDHGTALELAATGRADVGSLRTALATAVDIAGRQAT